MLLLTATSTPLSNTDARYIYRCLDASSKQVFKLSTFLESTTNRYTNKTFLSRCHVLAHSLQKKILRCTTILGDRNIEFNTLLEKVAVLVSSLVSRLNFPVRFRSKTRRGCLDRGEEVSSLLDHAKNVKALIMKLLRSVGEMLAARVTVPTSAVGNKEGEPNSSLLEEFFVKVERDKGWKIQRGGAVTTTLPVKKREPNLLEKGDSFAVGCSIVDEVTLPYNTLLSNEIEVGLISFSIILLEAYKLPETVLAECGNTSSLHKVFGTYVILQNIALMGIHQDLMRIIKAGKEKIDDDRFRYLIPYLRRNYPETEEILSRTFPSGPPRFARHHYYSPLLPRKLIKTPRFSLGNWNFLTNRGKKSEKHLLHSSSTT